MICYKLLFLHGILQFGVWIADVGCCASYIYHRYNEKYLHSVHILSYMNTF